MKMQTLTSMIALSLVAGMSASAQDGPADNQVMSVYERYRPDFSAPGARTGSFLFYPTIEAGVRTDSNIFAQRGPGEEDDFIFGLKPGFQLQSDWNNNSFSFYGNADIARYSDNDRENFEDFNIGAQGRIDVSRGTEITYGAQFSDLHEDRGSADNPGAPANQTFYQRYGANIGFKRDVSLISLAIDGSYMKMDFDDAPLVGGGIFNNDDRDRERLEGKVRIGYEMDENYEAFVRVTGNVVNYDDSKEDGGPQRNSDGWEVVGGAAFDITGKTMGEFFGGYVVQNYDSDTLGKLDDFTFGASLLWNPTGLTSVRGTVSRTVTETTLFDVNSVGDDTPAAGILGTLFDLQVEHELQRNLLLKGAATYIKQNFENTVRDDDLIETQLSARYLMNRNFSLDASYQFKYRDTTAQGQDYKRHIFMVSLTAQW